MATADLKKFSDSINQRLEIMENQFKKFKSDVENCVCITKDDIKSDIDRLFEKLNEFCTVFNDFEDRIDYLERQSKVCDMVISGIPKSVNLEPITIFKRICTKIDFNAPQFAIHSIFRVSSNKHEISGPSMPIIIRFSSQSVKSNFSKKYKEFGDLKLEHIGLTLGTRIYCNDGLTRQNSILFREARTMQKKSRISKVFTKFGSIFVIPNNTSEAKRILSLKQLIQLSSTRVSHRSDNGDDAAPTHSTQTSSSNSDRKQPISLSQSNADDVVDNIFNETLRPRTTVIETRSKTGSASSETAKPSSSKRNRK